MQIATPSTGRVRWQRTAHAPARASVCPRGIGNANHAAVPAQELYNHSSIGSDAVSHLTGRLRLYLDSADAQLWKRYAATGMLYGVTTNPTILERDSVKGNQQSFRDLLARAHDIGLQELQWQACGDSLEEMLQEALLVVEADTSNTRTVVKLPCTETGLAVAHRLRTSTAHARSLITITGIYAAHQVLVAQAVGANYAAPYLGRMNDIYKQSAGVPEGGYQQVVTMARMLQASGSSMRLLVASLRDAHDLGRLTAEVSIGVHAAVSHAWMDQGSLWGGAYWRPFSAPPLCKALQSGRSTALLAGMTPRLHHNRISAVVAWCIMLCPDE
jgi:transaldolase